MCEGHASLVPGSWQKNQLLPGACQPRDEGSAKNRSLTMVLKGVACRTHRLLAHYPHCTRPHVRSRDTHNTAPSRREASAGAAGGAEDGAHGPCVPAAAR